MFHLSHPSMHLPVVVVALFCVWVCFGVGFLFVFASLVLQVLGDVLFFQPRVLDDRQCFTARSARRQKKTAT